MFHLYLCCLLPQTFEANCAACHAGGNNSVIPDHTLRKAAMEQFLQGGFNLEGITYQVRHAVCVHV